MLYIFVEHLSIHPFQQWGRRREHIIYPVIVVDGSIQKIVQDGPCHSKYLAWQTCLKLDLDDNHRMSSLRQFCHPYGHGLDRVEHPDTALSIKRFNSVGWNILMTCQLKVLRDTWKRPTLLWLMARITDEHLLLERWGQLRDVWTHAIKWSLRAHLSS